MPKKSPDLSEPNAILQDVAAQFVVHITPAMQELIDPNDASDPIAAQFLPSQQEYFIHPEELADPISDKAFSPIEGIVHRHSDRVLLKLLYVCAVHCRFCFRREQIGTPQSTLSDRDLDTAMSYIAENKNIWEVILTGGDPLVLSDRRLSEVMKRLNTIEHVKIIRIHTRMPTVDPSRITLKLIQALKGSKPVYILLHCNHPRELTPEARNAIALLVDHGIPLLSQSVLLRGVNDNPRTLMHLMKSFAECRVKPHYIHHGDLARGTSHFRLPLAKGQELLKSLRGLSGLCQPTYILDIPGGHGKIPVDHIYAQQQPDKSWVVEDHNGRTHPYRDSIGNRTDE